MTDNEKAAIASKLLALYKRHQSSPVFAAGEASFLTSVARQVEAKGYLSDKQALAVGFKLTRYQTDGPVTPIRLKPPPSSGQPDNSVVLSGDTYRIRIPFGSGLKDGVKALPARWNAKDKIWEAAAHDLIREKLAKMGLSPPALPTTTPCRLELKGFGKTLRPFQLQGAKKIEEWNGQCLLGDEMGLGKTVQALAYLYAHPELRPTLIICPQSLKLNWAEEIEACLGEKDVYIISGRKPGKLPPAQFYIINYDIISDVRDRVPDMDRHGVQRKTSTGKPKFKRVTLPGTGWKDHLPAVKMAVVDECHKMIDFRADRTKDTLAYLNDKKRCDRWLALSGTPFLSRPIQLYPVVSSLRPRLLPPFMQFGDRYCSTGKYNPFGKDFSGASNTEELHQLLTRTVMIRRLKKDVLKDLPDKVHSIVPMELTGKMGREYARAEADLIAWLSERRPDKVDGAVKAEYLVRFQVLRELSIKAKLPSVSSWIEETLEGGLEKIIVFAVHHHTMDHLMKTLKDFRPVKVDGRDSTTARQAAVKAFQTDPATRVFIGNVDAAGVGLTLTAAHTVAFAELPLTPGQLKQAEDRAHRMTQTNAVNVYCLVSAGSIEKEVAALLDQKSRTLSAVLDGQAPDDGTLLTELIRKYNKNHPKK